MRILAGRKFQEKIGISFALLSCLIAINTIVAGVVVYSIASMVEKQREIVEIIQEIEHIRLTVSGFINSLDRNLSKKVFDQTASTRHRIVATAPKHKNGKLPSLLPQLDDFKVRFQKYIIVADQKAALESRALSLGGSMMERLKGLSLDGSVNFDQETFDAVIARMLGIMWQSQELHSGLHYPSIEDMSGVKAELDALHVLMNQVDDTYTKRQLFRMYLDARDFVTSYESHVYYHDLADSNEQELFRIAAQIQGDCDDISSEVVAAIRRHIVFGTAIMVTIFLITLVAAPELAKYLTAEILKPILSLVSKTKQVAAGQLNVRANVEVEDDIGEISHHFNRMTASLEQSQEQLLDKHRALEEAHFELEKRVERRTRELAAANVSLQSEIESRKQTEEEIRASEEKFRAMFELSSLGMARNNLEGDFLEANQALLDMLGYDLDALRQRRLQDLYADDSDVTWTSLVFALKKCGRYSLREVCIQSQCGQILFVRFEGVLVADGEGSESIWSICEDVTEQRKSEEVIWHQANFDQLTGLPNRRMFHNNLDQAIKNSNRQSRPMALMFLDLDKFKEVNDTYGHDMGDMLLIDAARRITACVRETDVVARLGGDEFTVILSSLDNASNAERVARKIIENFAQPFILAGENIYIGISVGATFYPNDANDIEALMRNADQAMYQAKADGRNRLCYFTRALQESSRQRLRLINDLRTALGSDQFELYYQPIVDMGGGDIHKAEALIRWHHPRQGLVNPSDFIPLAEETNLITEIGDWVFSEAVDQVKQLRKSYNPQFQVSINKSPIQFYADHPSGDDWLGILSGLDLDRHAMAIEITEGLLLEATDKVKNCLMRYREAGLQVALDDFGTGYSSLAYLNRFDIDYLKIDKTFVRNLAPDSKKSALCEAIIMMAHKLGLKVVAEGVETALQHELLKSAGCDYAQGFYYCCPLPAREFELLLSSQHGVRSKKAFT